MEFDYEYLAKCEYGVYNPAKASGEDDCGEPAIAKVWWEDGEPIYVCKEHLEYMIKMEEENE